MTTTDARKRQHERDTADAHATYPDQESDIMTEPQTKTEWLADIAVESHRTNELLTEIRDRMPERVEAKVAPFDPDVIAANLEAIRHEAETPMRGHGECCDPAPADGDPDEAWARERWAESANIASWSALHPETQRVLVDFARAAREHLMARETYTEEGGRILIGELTETRRRAEKLEADLARVTEERDRLAHLLGSHADGHRCTCEEIDPGKPGIEPPTWEQDPWCLTHPDMDMIVAEVKTLEAKADRYKALREDVSEKRWDNSVLGSDRGAYVTVVLRGILDRDDERAES